MRLQEVGLCRDLGDGTVKRMQSKSTQSRKIRIRTGGGLPHRPQRRSAQGRAARHGAPVYPTPGPASFVTCALQDVSLQFSLLNSPSIIFAHGGAPPPMRGQEHVSQ